MHACDWRMAKRCSATRGMRQRARSSRSSKGRGSAIVISACRLRARKRRREPPPSPGSRASRRASARRSSKRTARSHCCNPARILAGYSRCGNACGFALGGRTRVELEYRFAHGGSRPPRFKPHTSPVGAWLSLVEHSVRDRGVVGSNPIAPTNFPNKTRVIQSV